MRYQGGKTLIAKPIAEIISAEREREREDVAFVSLFCGTCAVESKLVDCFDKVICNDKNRYIVEMFKAFQNGYEFPDFVDYEMWDYVRNHKEENLALTGFIGFGCSFGGRFFQGYARNKGDRNNCAKEAKNSLLKIKDAVQKMEFSNLDYQDVLLPNDCIVYCDPPYNNTKSYVYDGKFDSDKFWDYMRIISRDHLVFISEQNAPGDFVSIWEKSKPRCLSKDPDKRFHITEHLYVHNSLVNKIKGNIVS